MANLKTERKKLLWTNTHFEKKTPHNSGYAPGGKSVFG